MLCSYGLNGWNILNDWNNRKAMPYSTSNGVKIYYEVSGEGFPFVMIHANPFDHNLWMYQIAHFSTHFKVIAIDIRGYGRSDKPDRKSTRLNSSH